MKPTKKCIDLIKSFEGLFLKPYPDPGTNAKPYTIGYGTTIYPNGKEVTMQDKPITEAQAEEYLMHEVEEKAVGVNAVVKVAINSNQFDALVCFGYNVGNKALKDSTLLKLLNAGDISGAAEQFLRWNKAGGKVMNGLTRRRQAERSLFLQSPEPQKKEDLLPDGPSDEEIKKKLEDIEKDIK